MLAIGLEAGDGLRLGVGIDLQQELAGDRHPRNASAVGQRQLHTADDARAGAVQIGEELKVQAAGEATQEFDVDADRTGDAHVGVAVDVDRGGK